MKDAVLADSKRPFSFSVSNPSQHLIFRQLHTTRAKFALMQLSTGPVSSQCLPCQNDLLLAFGGHLWLKAHVLTAAAMQPAAVDLVMSEKQPHDDG